MSIRSNAAFESDAYNLLGVVGRDGFGLYDSYYFDLFTGFSGLVLDLGCGFGSDFLLWLRERVGFSGKIINMDADLRVFSEEYANMNPDFRYRRPTDSRLIANAEDIPLRSGSISLVNQCGMFADIEGSVNSSKVFGEVYRVLGSRGLYVLNDSFAPTLRDGFVQIAGSNIDAFGVYRKRSF